MIQRIQSVWLLLAAACAVLTFKFSFYSGTVANEEGVNYLTATSTIFLLVLTTLLVVCCLVLIFMFKTRKRQLRLTIAAFLLSVLNIVLYFLEVKKFATGTYSLTAVLALAIPILLFLAARGIWKDEKLIKSLDRLR